MAMARCCIWKCDEGAEVREGDRLTVRVESVFDGGMVVCYQDRAGLSVRGALLEPQISLLGPTLIGGEMDLANPMSLLHDHPYATLDKFARDSVAVPDAVLDHWNSPSKLPGANIITIGNRTKKIVEHMCGDLEPKESKCMASECHQTPVISIPVPNEEPCLYSSQRQAKVQATEKIKHTLSELSMKEKGARRRLSMDLNKQNSRVGTLRRSKFMKSSSLVSSRSDASSSSSSSTNFSDLQNRQSEKEGPVRGNRSGKSSSLESSRSDESSSESVATLIERNSALSCNERNNMVSFNGVGPFSAPTSPSPSVVSVRDFTIDLTRVTCRPPSGGAGGRHTRRLAECKVQRLPHTSMVTVKHHN